LQSLYAIVNAPADGTQRIETSGDLEDSTMLATVWTGTYFDEYDYDSFDYEDSSYHFADDDSDSIFDS